MKNLTIGAICILVGAGKYIVTEQHFYPCIGLAIVGVVLIVFELINNKKYLYEK